ncbi:mitochondrial carrier [Ramicandelaber brevisporus]|nr:mitochondrial carrier [Ramicandelaber brevisporus]
MSSGDSSMLKSFLSGGFGGMCLVVVGAPFDLVKVRMQTSANGTYSSTLDCFRKTFATDGIKGFYRGMSTPLVGITPVYATCFWGYDVGFRLAHRIWGTTPGKDVPTLGQILFAGGFSAIPTTALMTPIERIKVVLQVQGQTPGVAAKYSGPLAAAAGIIKEGGIKSLYRGTVATLMRDVPGSVAYFGAYEVVKKLLTPEGSDPSQLKPGAILFAGGMAGVANWTVAIPPDVLKSRLQSAPAGQYSGLKDVFVHMMKTEGPRALFKGLPAAMIRAFPANAACFFGVEFSRNLLNKTL